MVAPLVLNNYIITAITIRRSNEAKEMLALTEDWLNRGLFLCE